MAIVQKGIKPITFSAVIEPPREIRKVKSYVNTDINADFEVLKRHGDETMLLRKANFAFTETLKRYLAQGLIVHNGERICHRVTQGIPLLEEETGVLYTIALQHRERDKEYLITVNRIMLADLTLGHPEDWEEVSCECITLKPAKDEIKKTIEDSNNEVKVKEEKK